MTGAYSPIVAGQPVVTVATPAYLEAHGEPAIPAELEQHSCIIYAPQGSPRVWGFRDRFGPVMHNPKCAFRTNDAEQIRAAVLSGSGIAHAPGWLFGAEIASGAVRDILTDYAPRPLAITAVRPAGRFLASKVRVFADFLAELFAQEPSLALNRAGTEGLSDQTG
ncbi:hypothetical protein FJ930_26765 [Mesorhizobium sp. B2-4-15]|uniref:substrate binding domain-containing protein n=1 Tax=Mesorhizobium sp. B2-4-15 TaxID=2589934 RepID=UPI00114EBA96|nr:hypothetical protein FJ930_26765 [Mesorhizobium sp. B2-4-15]